MAVGLEKKKSKNDILRDYLNIANFGHGTYGVEAASQYFFGGTSASKLSIPQAALLAGQVQSPTRFNPLDHPQAALNRRNIVLARMHELSAITDAEYKAAVASPVVVKQQQGNNGCIQAKDSAFFCSYVQNAIIKDPTYKALGKTEEERSNTLKRGGLIIRTTLDGDLQSTAKKTVEDKVPTGDKSGVGAAAVTVEPGTGRVLAMVQNRDFNNVRTLRQTAINFNADYAMGSSQGFQPGSTFKSFTLATWLSKGKGLYDVVDASRKVRSFREFDGCNGRLGQATYEFGNSEGHEGGSMTVMDATRNSVNTAFVDMAAKVSLCDISATAAKLGVHKAWAYDAGDCQHEETTKLPDCTPSMVLGSLDVAPVTMAAAYAAFAADGKYCPPVVISSIADRNGKSLSVPPNPCTQALDTNVARGVTFALKQVLVNGTAAGQGIGRPAAGKTGTTDGSKDTWFIGYTPQRTTAVWVGDNPSPTDGRARHSINGRTIGGNYHGQVYGSTIAAPIWHTIMMKANDGLPEKDWANPTGKILDGSSVRVPDVVGLPINAAKAQLEAAGFDVAVSDQQVPSNLGPDRVAEMSPKAGSRTASKSKITISPGDGKGSPAGQNNTRPGNGDPNFPDGFPLGNRDGQDTRLKQPIVVPTRP